MIRAMAKEAEATRERTAAVIRAEGELLAAENLLKAAQGLQGDGTALELRRLQTIERISKEPNGTTVLVPLDIFKGLDRVARAMEGQVARAAGEPVLLRDDPPSEDRNRGRDKGRGRQGGAKDEKVKALLDMLNKRANVSPVQ